MVVKFITKETVRVLKTFVHRRKNSMFTFSLEKRLLADFDIQLFVNQCTMIQKLRACFNFVFQLKSLNGSVLKRNNFRTFLTFSTFLCLLSSGTC